MGRGTERAYKSHKFILGALRWDRSQGCGQHLSCSSQNATPPITGPSLSGVSSDEFFRTVRNLSARKVPLWLVSFCQHEILGDIPISLGSTVSIVWQSYWDTVCLCRTASFLPGLCQSFWGFSSPPPQSHNLKVLVSKWDHRRSRPWPTLHGCWGF